MIRLLADLNIAPYPIPVSCKGRGYPHEDEFGFTQFDNSHFDTEQEAWESLTSNASARRAAIASRLSSARSEVKRLERELADAALEETTVERLSTELESRSLRRLYNEGWEVKR